MNIELFSNAMLAKAESMSQSFSLTGMDLAHALEFVTDRAIVKPVLDQSERSTELVAFFLGRSS